MRTINIDRIRIKADTEEDDVLLHQISGQLIVNDSPAILAATGSQGYTEIQINNLPTADPQVSGVLWQDSGYLKISLG